MVITTTRKQTQTNANKRKNDNAKFQQAYNSCSSYC